MLHSLIEGFKNISRSFWLSATAITVLFVSLVSVTVVIGLRTVVSTSLDQLDKQLSISFYLKDTVDVTDLNAIKEDIVKINGVEKVEFISKEDAKNNISNSGTKSAIDGYQEDIGDNPLLNSFNIIF